MLECYADDQWALQEQAKQARKDQAPHRPPKPTTPIAPHTWQWHKQERRWVCTACQTRATKRNGTASRQTCRGEWGKAQRWCHIAHNNGHNIYVADRTSDNPGQVITCTDCGLYADWFPRKLGEPCPGYRRTYKANRIRAGKHPRKPEMLHNHRRWKPGRQVTAPSWISAGQSGGMAATPGEGLANTEASQPDGVEATPNPKRDEEVERANVASTSPQPPIKAQQKPKCTTTAPAHHNPPKTPSAPGTSSEKGHGTVGSSSDPVGGNRLTLTPVSNSRGSGCHTQGDHQVTVPAVDAANQGLKRKLAAPTAPSKHSRPRSEAAIGSSLGQTERPPKDVSASAPMQVAAQVQFPIQQGSPRPSAGDTGQGDSIGGDEVDIDMEEDPFGWGGEIYSDSGGE